MLFNTSFSTSQYLIRSGHWSTAIFLEVMAWSYGILSSLGIPLKKPSSCIAFSCISAFSESGTVNSKTPMKVICSLSLNALMFLSYSFTIHDSWESDELSYSVTLPFLRIWQTQSFKFGVDTPRTLPRSDTNLWSPPISGRQSYF